MNKVTVKNLIEFRKKSEISKKKFVNKLRKELDNPPPSEAKEKGEGGDYWVTSSSAIRSFFKLEKNDIIDNKIEELKGKYENNSDERIKSMYERNIKILSSFKEYDFRSLKFNGEIQYLKALKANSILMLDGFPIYTKPCHIFSLTKKDKKEIGATWFIPKLNGYKKNELGMFCEMLFKYLNKHYSSDYYVNPKYCTAIDLYKSKEVKYSQLQSGEVPFLIDSTIAEMKKL